MRKKRDIQQSNKEKSKAENFSHKFSPAKKRLFYMLPSKGRSFLHHSFWSMLNLVILSPEGAETSTFYVDSGFPSREKAVFLSHRQYFPVIEPLRPSVDSPSQIVPLEEVARHPKIQRDISVHTILSKMETDSL